MRFTFLLSLAAVAGLASAQFQPIGAPFKSPVTVASGLSARVIYTNLTALGAIAFDAEQNLLAVELGVGVSAFTPVTSPSPGWVRNIVIKNPDASYGIEVDGPRLYVSTGKDVLLYAYDASTTSIVSGFTPYPVVDGIPSDGEFSSHPITLERNATSGKAIAILIGSGPLTNIDPTARDPASGRSQIRRFVFPTIQPAIFPPPPLHWADGEVVGYGLRNPSGFAFAPTPSISSLPVKPTPTLYVVDNGASIDNVTSIGVTPKFANDNPADELDVISYATDRGKFYGFPDCTTLWNPDADPVGVPQYAGLAPGDQISLNLGVGRDDKWCRDGANNKAAVLPLPAHSAVTDIKFYAAPVATSVTSLPQEYAGDAFVSFFGSFNRDPPTGYGVVRIYLPIGSAPTKEGYSFIIQAKDLASCPGTCITPAGLAFSGGRLFFSSVLTGELVVVERSSFTTNTA
ncbi:putative pyrroloquinoline quinone binding [Lyophyllum shimeji]|uniref:Pyrroloquinoline quinone binding n=1 Tax=Lyophyllum shimeji TaxID=47721 RepID=A0A9P3PQN6_LYOSH|nr:putative pyrroloquinoline quinone binding [Lyophyllum shimeji]